ncbi:hypothetical protein GCM10023195_86680 [Actinoallomurus liliacearum]|uniref:Uncharacterized protein n=1 Tax=Actinoallomurus liliacearum TaxID=1080073 RepID=A0ABP8U0C3_9ACTN
MKFLGVAKYVHARAWRIVPALAPLIGACIPTTVAITIPTTGDQACLTPDGEVDRPRLPGVMQSPVRRIVELSGLAESC